MNADAALYPDSQSAPTARSSDLLATLNSVERHFPVAEWTVNGTPVWPLLRLRWFYAQWARLYADTSTLGGGSFGTVVGRMLAGRLAAIKARSQDSARTDRGLMRRDLVLLSDGVSFARLGKVWYERFCDPIMAAAEQRNLSSELWTPLHRYHRPRASASDWFQPAVDRLNLAGALFARAWPQAAHLAQQPAVEAAFDAAGFDSSEFSPSRILSDGARLRFLAAMFRRRLQRTRPRLAFVVSYYNLEAMAFVLACRQLGIAVVDVQHGAQGELHPAYAAWPRLASGEHHALLPDFFWVWSRWEAQVIEQWASGSSHAAVIGGYPWFDIWRGECSWPGAQAAIGSAQALKLRANDLPVVLVTLQYGLTPPEQLDPLVRLLQRAGDKFAFWVRLHPAMLERREEIRNLLRAGGGRFELDECTDLPLPALLPHSSALITHSSSTCIEAAQFCVPAIITSAFGTELYAPVLDSGHATFEPGDAAALENTLSRLVRSRSATANYIDAPGVAATLDRLLALAGSPERAR